MNPLSYRIQHQYTEEKKVQIKYLPYILKPDMYQESISLLEMRLVRLGGQCSSPRYDCTEIQLKSVGYTEVSDRCS